MKKKLLEMIAAKEARKKELREKSKKTDSVEELRGINAEVDTIDADLENLRAALADAPDEADPPADLAGEQRSAPPAGALNPLATYGGMQTARAGEISDETKKKYEKRGEELKNKKAITASLEETAEERAVTVASGDLVVQKKYATEMSAGQNEVSSLIDNVNAVPLPGGESYTKAFEVSMGEGDYTTETGNYVETDPVTDYVEIGKAKITAYAEITDEATKLPNINYQALVLKNVRTAIRKKITKQLMIGPGGANAITGIYNAPSNVIPADTDITIDEIDIDTLDKIVFGYGGDEDVEGMGYLVLNKKDLAEFAAIRNANGDKMYDISINGNTGVISSKGSFKVPYIINSACPALSSVATADGTYCMAFGNLKAYEMPVFSPLTVEESRDYKFRTGQIAYRGSIWAGGNVASYKGFVRIKKG